jgi:hypothetical protein
MSQADDLQERSRTFALEVIGFVGTIPTLLETRRIKSIDRCLYQRRGQLPSGEARADESEYWLSL